MTIDELARTAGTTTRNVRAYQTRGLLPPPRIESRVGYYDPGHLARLRLIAALQERGFGLAAIAHLLRAWDRRMSLTDLLGFEEALTEPWAAEAEARLTRADLDARYPALTADDALVRHAVEAGLLVEDGDGYRVPNPPMLAIGARLVALGIPVSRALEEFQALRADTAAIARRFVDLFEQFVWSPFVQAGMPAGGLAELTRSLRHLRPLASEAISAAFGAAMEEAVNAAAAGHVLELGANEPAAS